ncbi:hypothetical protein ANOM_002401 [Aspergillus nomiae NRRL 13137]|uniref:Xylanolytic transcriptional activator regulatory domain-containing protein n=1 Tax=Aspergillus nomiae NRRL (strain ATCC 15546 / NRRL 13137 / CBS 260.88 / M93) TaxID=1509407 RepID=A0A0L1JC82_ASPN3|nr:uncharacterized protein ANOM_002401 [Aspergillus nomiae NRRL 13137]KNG89013.1 hypothetical protein ANOM_002401 [Aspergillus nomiae NRRL 13137]
MESPDVRGTAVPLTSDTETPACQSCRSRVDCYYDYTKNKPGVKVGIIQTLTQRVESLEAQLEGLRTQHQADSGIPSPASTVQDVNALRTLVSSMMEEWRENNTSPNNAPDQRLNSPPDRDVHDSTIQTSSPETSRKRPCPDSRSFVDSAFQVDLPPDNLMNGILDAYFSVVHPFIPILHEPLFRSRLRDPAEKPKLMPILHAMMVCALRYVANERLAADWSTSHPGALQKSRDFVVLSSIDSLSVEGAQSLIIIAFVHICDGNASKAWPIVGALTRAVVYMGLHCEPDEDQQGDSCVQPFRYLPSARVWTEMEERRRVFWNVFLLDRFSSFTTGWNMSLSSDDVRLRLPSDGTYWAKEEPVTTPFFNIWDTSLAKIGKSVSFLPGHFSSIADKEKDVDSNPSRSERVSPVLQAPGARSVDLSTIGSFAYCIEATESLNRIVKYFLQRPVNFQSKQEFGAWLTRFKELDLQLIHWKMFLPRRWKDSNISKEPAFVHMDPNLTLAHITHNTSMILLHQCIAYPRANLVDKLKQASISSAETCQLAASETANIVQKYLQYTPFVGLVNAQFVFCAFVSARVMLVHSHLHRTELPEGYSVLLWSLQQMSARWVSSNPNLRLTLKTDNFASGLLSQLQKLQERCKYVEPFELDALGYAIEVSFALGIRSPPASLGESQWVRERRAQQRHSIIPVNGQRSHYMNSSPCAHRSDQCSDHDHASQPVVAPSVNVTPSGPPVASDATIRDMGQWNGNQISNQQRMNTLRARDAYPSQTGPMDGLFPSASAASPLDGSDSFAALSNFLLDPQYLDMDRIISFQDSFTH